MCLWCNRFWGDAKTHTAHHQSEVGTTLGDNLVTLVGQVGNANAGSDLSWGHYYMK